MKLQMKLRTRLFLGFSALMTVALLGLLLALVSVVQMAQSQEKLIRDNFGVIEVNQKLRQALGNQLLLLVRDKRDNAALDESRDVFRSALVQGASQAPRAEDRQAYREIGDAYGRFLDQLRAPTAANSTLPT